ncbi:hypothetical protein HYY75_05670 [bacterium]|nr:hypothetical protein [bacterium]
MKRLFFDNLKILIILFFLVSQNLPLICLAKEGSPENSQISITRESAKKMVREGINFLILEQYKKAEESFIQAKSLDPYSEEAYNFLGLLYFQQGLFEKTKDMFNRATFT